jgi:hypothetical protein
MNRMLYQATAVALVAALTAGGAHAGLRCGKQLITEGDSVLKLLRSCGEPTIGDPLYFGIAEWTYNFGPHQFMKRVRIEDGLVQRIEGIGFGVAPPPAAGPEPDQAFTWP